MKKSVCFYFQIHLPYQFRRYRFFDIGNSDQYYDEFNIRTTLQKRVENTYLPMNKILLDLIKQYKGQFKVAFSITGETIEQLQEYAPHVLDSFKELAATGAVEFLCETYSHSLAFLKDENELDRQLLKQAKTIEKCFGTYPKVVRLTGLIYSDQIGERVAKLGFKGIITEGAKHILGWKSPNYVYTNAYNNNLKVLLRNYQLSDDVAYRFSDTNWDQWPVTADKYATWVNEVKSNADTINLFMDYITFGDRHSKESGIFEFMKNLPEAIFKLGDFEFSTPSEVISKYDAKSPVHVPYPISWSEEERDLSIWLGNDLQNDAFNSLCDLDTKVVFVDNPNLIRDWERLQDSDNYYYMGTKWLSDGSNRRFRSVYSSPYDAYINYMNVLSDLILRVEKQLDDKIKSLFGKKEYKDKLLNIVTQEQDKYTNLQIKKIQEIISVDQPKEKKPKQTQKKA